MCKKGVKRIITAIMATALMLTSVGISQPDAASAASVKKSGDYRYVKYSNGVKITEYTGKAKKLTIPAKIAGKKVVAIDTMAFREKKSLKQVKMSKSIRKIGSCAFENCKNLEKVVLPEKLEQIGSGAFGGTAIKSITIPDGVETIGELVFAECKKLKEVKLSDNVKIIGYNAFDGCEKLSKINLENVEEIRTGAFKNNKSFAGRLVFKNAVVIQSEAFYGCSGITGVEFSDTLQFLGSDVNNPFAYCSNIETYEVDVNNSNYTSIDGVMYNKTKDTLVAYPAKKGGVVNIPDTVNEISGYAFSGAKISQLNMGKGVYTIGEYAFAESDVTDVTMPLVDEGVAAKWESNAFLNCKSLKKVVFPDGLRSPNSVAFINCTALTEVILPKRMTDVSKGMFFGCTSLETIVLPKELKTISAGCFYGCKSLKNVNLDNIQFIEPVSFYGCESLSGVLNLNVNAIMTAAFANCTNITEVNFNEELTKMTYQEWDRQDIIKIDSFYGDFDSYENNRDLIIRLGNRDIYLCMAVANPFAGCSKLTKINVLKEGEAKSIDGVLYTSDMKRLITYPAGLTGKYNVPYGVETIGKFAFEGAAVSEVVCSNSVSTIEQCAFYGSSVNSVTISKSVNEIKLCETAFEKCSKLEQINVQAGNQNYESIDGVLYSISDGNTRLMVYPSARKGKSFEVPKNAYIANNAFKDCVYLKKVYITNKKKDNIDCYFKNCKNIKLYLPKNYILNYIETPKKGKYSFGFGDNCTGCKTYVKKKSALAKKLDKKKIKYYKY